MKKNLLWACGVNLPWQDCWDGSASTATLRELSASPSTRQQSSHSRPRPIRTLQRWQARARSSFLSVAMAAAFSFLFLSFLREKPEDTGSKEWQRNGEREKTFLSSLILYNTLLIYTCQISSIWFVAGSTLACMNYESYFWGWRVDRCVIFSGWSFLHFLYFALCTCIFFFFFKYLQACFFSACLHMDLDISTTRRYYGKC